MIVDFHTHIFPDAIAGAAMAKLSENEGGVPHYLNATLSDLLCSMDNAKIDRAVTLPIATRPGQERSILSFSKELLANPRIVPFFSTHPDSPDAVSYIEKAAAEGLRGIKIHPYYQNTALDDRRYETMAKAASEAGLIFLTHAGFDPAYPRQRIADARKVLKLKERVPDLVLIAAHFGGFDDWEGLEMLVGSGVYLDTSFALHFFSSEKMSEMILRHGGDYVIFGSDSPWTKQDEELSKIQSLALDSALIDKIKGGNALRLLNDVADRGISSCENTY